MITENDDARGMRRSHDFKYALTADFMNVRKIAKTSNVNINGVPFDTELVILESLQISQTFSNLICSIGEDALGRISP